jgi:glycosyltransferase involved in cell wall biosynthesis
VSSTLAALPRDAELVVFDDGSTDATAQVLSTIRHPQLRVILNTANVGSGVARQRLLQESDSRLVANMDADDISLPWRFRQLRMLQRVDIAFASAVIFRSRRVGAAVRLPIAYTNRELEIALLIHNPLTHSTMVGHRAAIERIGGYSDLPYAQDYDLWLRAAANGVRLAKKVVPTVAYRISDAQVSRRPDYSSAVLAETALASSYFELMSRVAPAAYGLVVAGTPLDSREIAVELAALTADFAPVARRYYRNLMRTSAPQRFDLREGGRR